MDQEVVQVGQLEVRASKNKWVVRYPVPGLSAFVVRADDGAEHAPHDIKVRTHPEFDRTFLVWSQDALLVRRLWTADACQRACDMQLTWAAGSVEELELSTRNLRGEVVATALGLGLIEALDAADPFGIYAMRALPEAEFKHADARARQRPMVVVPGMIDVVVHPVHLGGVAVTAVRAEGSSDRVRPDVDLRTLRIHDTDVGREQVERIGAARFRQQGNHLYLVWYQIIHSVEVVAAGIALLRAVLASASRGPYR